MVNSVACQGILVRPPIGAFNNEEAIVIKKWNVYVTRDDHAQFIGEVSDSDEGLARCAALSRFAVTEEEVAAGEISTIGAVIYPDESFSVSLAM